jgi:peptide/nickel transport system substrate-binding protein
MIIVRSRRSAIGAALLVSALVTAPIMAPGAGQAAQAQDGTILRIGVTQEIDSLNPFQAVFLVSTQALRINYEYLTMAGAKDSSPEPGLAESWEPSSDNLTWTFKIREGMQWSDGKPITARDVAFTYNLIMTNEDAATANGVAVTNYASVEATDDLTLVIKTKQPQASILSSDVPIVPEHVWKDHVGNIKDFKNSDAADLPVVGSGPYVITGYEEGRSVTLSANDKFWRGRPKVDQMQFVKYENADAAVQGLIKGDIDSVFRLTPAQFEALEKQPNIATHAGNDRRYSEITLNPSNPKPDGTTFGNGNPVLKDVKVRQAIDYAIDRKTIIDRVKGGYAKPATQLIPPVYPDWTYDLPADKRRDFDPDRANQLLDEAGYPKGADGIRVDKQGQPINLRLLGNSDRVQDEQTARYVEEWLEAVGLGVTFENKSSNQSSDDQNAGNFDMAFTGWSVSPDPEYSLGQQVCAVVGTDLGDTNFCDAEYDRLYAQQQAELDEGKRQQLVQEMQGILYDKVSAIIVTYDQLLEAYRSDRFSGFETQPADGGVINNQSGYWGYYGAVPVEAGGGESSGMSTGAVIGIIAGAVVLIGVLGFALTRRRRATADERE